MILFANRWHIYSVSILKKKRLRKIQKKKLENVIFHSKTQNWKQCKTQTFLTLKRTSDSESGTKKVKTRMDSIYDLNFVGQCTLIFLYKHIHQSLHVPKICAFSRTSMAKSSRQSFLRAYFFLQRLRLSTLKIKALIEN